MKKLDMWDIIGICGVFALFVGWIFESNLILMIAIGISSGWIISNIITKEEK